MIFSALPTLTPFHHKQHPAKSLPPRHRRFTPFLPFLLLTLSIFNTANAAINNQSPRAISGNTTLVHQMANHPLLHEETNITASLLIHYAPQTNGYWRSHIEASNTPNKNAVTSTLGDSNANAGNDDDQPIPGTVQISELNYSLDMTPSITATLGLVDATIFLDSSNISNDATTSFIAPSFVNNPLIDFPDYVLGSAFNIKFSKNYSSQLVISSTDGIADNNSRNYSDLFEIGGDEKGAFVGIEGQYATDVNFLKLGSWVHTGEHQAVHHSLNNDLNNYGAYVTAGTQLNHHHYEMRLGYANPQVSTATRFASLSYQYTQNKLAFGTGYSQTVTSEYLTDNNANQTAQLLELYGRYQAGTNWYLTPSMQVFKKPILNTSAIDANDAINDIWTANVRLSYFF